MPKAKCWDATLLGGDEVCKRVALSKRDQIVHQVASHEFSCLSGFLIPVRDRDEDVEHPAPELGTDRCSPNHIIKFTLSDDESEPDWPVCEAECD